MNIKLNNLLKLLLVPILCIMMILPAFGEENQPQSLNEVTNNTTIQYANIEEYTLYNTYANLDLNIILDFLKYNSYIYTYSQKHLIDFCKCEDGIIDSQEVMNNVRVDFKKLTENEDNVSYTLKTNIQSCFEDYIKYLKDTGITYQTLTFEEYLKLNLPAYSETEYYLLLYKNNILVPLLDKFIWGTEVQSAVSNYKNSKNEDYLNVYINYINNLDLSIEPTSIKQLYQVFLKYYDSVKNNTCITDLEDFFLADIYELYAINVIHEECNKITEYDNFKLANGNFYFLATLDVFKEIDIELFKNYMSTLSTNNLNYLENIVLKQIYYDLLVKRMQLNKSSDISAIENKIQEFENYKKQLEDYYNHLTNSIGKNWVNEETVKSSIHTVNQRYAIVYNTDKEAYTYFSLQQTDNTEYPIVLPEKEEDFPIGLVIIIIFVVIIFCSLFIYIKNKKKEKEEELYNSLYNTYYQ